MQIFDVIAISIELPEHELNKGQIGTVVEILDDDHVLVEFSSSSGIAQKIRPLPISLLIPIEGGLYK